MIFSRLWKKISAWYGKSPKLFSVSAFSVVAVFLLGVILIAAPHSAQAASIGKTLAEGLASIILWIVSLLGKLLVLVIDLFINVAQYNNFIDSVPVSVGWSIVRDVCNMFFIVALLVIAFGTILKIERYRYNRLLVHLIIMAVLINFSKVIAGFFIDFGQVVMMTFVNAFKDAAAGNFTQAFRMREILELRDDIPEISGADYLGAAVLALAMVLIALVVMIALLVVVLVRIIMLWILVVLSPLAYLLSALPGAWQQQSSKWWSNFGKWVSIGPVLAFFVWLSLTIIGNPSGVNDNFGIDTTTKDTISASGQVVEGGTEGLPAAVSKASSTDNMLGFTLGISMLIMSLLTAQQMGGIAGSFAGKALSSIQSGARTVTGARWAGDRWRAFQGQREQKRKEKAAKFGARAYGIYEGAKSVPGAGFKAAGKGIDYLGEKAGTGVKKAIGGEEGTARARAGAAAGWLTAGAIKAGGRAAVAGGAGALTGGAAFGAYLGLGTFAALPTGKAMKEGSKAVSNFTKKLEKGFMNRVAASMTEKGDYVDSKGQSVNKDTAGHYEYHNQSGAYVKDDTMARWREQNIDLLDVSYDEAEKKWQAHLSNGQTAHLGSDELLTKDGNLVDKHGRLKDVDNPDLESKFDEATNRYYRVNARGEALNAKGDPAKNVGERVYTKTPIPKLPKTIQELGYGWALGRTQSWALRAKGEQERINKESQEMAAAGISPELMHRGLTDNNLSNDARRARGLALSARDGFKGMDVSMARSDVDLIKKLTSSNTLLAKEFQENMYKRFAHLYHDLSTESGRGQLKKAAAEGKVDLTRQDDTSLTPEFVKVMKEHFGKKFVSRLEDSATTDEREKNIKGSLKQLIKELGVKDKDSEGKLLPERVALANIAGDLAAFARVGTVVDEKTGKTEIVNDFENPGKEFMDNVREWYKTSKIEHIIKTDTDFLDPNASGKIAEKFKMSEADASRLIEKMREAVGVNGISDSQRKSIKSSRIATQKFKDVIEDIFKKYGPPPSENKKKKIITENLEEEFKKARGNQEGAQEEEDSDEDEDELT